MMLLSAARSLKPMGSVGSSCTCLSFILLYPRLLLFFSYPVLHCFIVFFSFFYLPIIGIHQRLCLVVLAFFDQLQDMHSSALHPCIDEIMPRCDGKSVQPALCGLEFQVDLAHQARHFASLLHDVAYSFPYYYPR